MAREKPTFWAYDPKQLEDALADVSRGMPVAAAAKKHGVPRTTVRRYISTRRPVLKKMGPNPVLSKEEEGILVNWIASAVKAGFPVTRNDLLDSVQKLIKELKRENDFVDDRPGRTWFSCFLKRNPSVTSRIAQNLTASRASVTKENLLNWFRGVYDYLESENLVSILQEPNRVFNADESAFFLNPTKNRVLAMKGDKNVYQQVNSNEKECITTLVCGNAAGDLGPPLIVFKYERVPNDIIESVPLSWGLGKSDSGWMNGDVFYQYVTNVFYPWLVHNHISLPIILFVDGHQSHLTLQTSEFCNNKGIVLVALYPNATHLIQPMDVSVFKSMKTHWRDGVHNWRRDSDKPELKKKDFCPVLKKVLEEKITPTIIQNGFRKSGLVPWNPLAPIETLERNQKKGLESEKASASESDLKIALNVIEQYLGKDKIAAFDSGPEWTGATEDKSLFHLWSQIKKDASKNSDNHPAVQDKESEDGLVDNTLTPVIPGTQDNKVTPPSTPPDSTPSLRRDLLGKCVNSDVVDRNVVNRDNFDLNHDNKCSSKTIPSPFKRSLKWPVKQQKVNARKKSSSGFCSVLTSEKWRENELNKINKKMEMAKLKEERKALRLKKKEEREELKRKKEEEKELKAPKVPKTNILRKKRVRIEPESSSDDEGSWRPSGNSTDDASLGLVSDMELEFGGVEQLGSGIYKDNEETGQVRKRKQRNEAHRYLLKLPLREGNSEDELDAFITNSNLPQSSGEKPLVKSNRENMKNNFNEGDFVLAKIFGKNKSYQCVCLVRSVRDNEFMVTTLKPCNRMRMVFVANEAEQKTVAHSDIMDKLPKPLIFGCIDNKRYQFPKSIEVPW